MASIRGEFQLFSCRPARPYAEQLILELDSIAAQSNEILFSSTPRVSKASILEFDDGEMDVIIDTSENVRDKDVFLVTCPYNTVDSRSVNTNIMESLLFIDALHRAKARSVSLISLYYPYSRGDKQHSKDGIPAKLLANIYKTAGVNNFITMDLHADQIIGFFDSQYVRVENLHASSLFIHYLKQVIGPDARIAAPDAGAAKRVQFHAKHLEKGMIMAYKKRSYDVAHQVDEMKILGLPGKDEVVIVDDMVASGGSVIKMIDKLKEKGVKKVIVACAHAILIKDAIKNFDAMYADKNNPFFMMLTTDSILHKEGIMNKPWFKQISTTRFMAKAIFEIHTSGSVTQLHDPHCVSKLNLWVD